MSEYRVNLDVFSGPLDLLLYLVRKEEVDIYDIPIARITEQYIKYIEILKDLDIDLAGDFLVMAATLMEIKSAMLLPAVSADEEGDTPMLDPRAELVRQLLEYKKFKDAANRLESSAEIRGDRFTRPDLILAGLKGNVEPEVDLDQVSLWTLLEVFEGILKSVGNYQSYEHISDDTPIDLYQIEILHRLQTEGPMTMEQIFKDRGNRLVMIGLFLGMLELIRLHLIWIEQPEPLGSIHVRALTDEPAEQAVPKAIYAAEAESAHESSLRIEPDSTSAEALAEPNDEEDLPEEPIFDDDSSPDVAVIFTPIDETKSAVETPVAEIHPRIPIIELPAQPNSSESPKPESSCPLASDEAMT